MAVEVRAIERAEFETYSKVANLTFGAEILEGEARDRLLEVLDLERTYAAFEGGEMVGTSGSFTMDLRVPGKSIAMAGFTMVCVRPTHRRRGILRAMVNKHEEDMRERGEAISGLWSSESSIYPRFGYGLAAESSFLDVDARHLRFLDHLEFDEMRFVEIDEAQDLLTPIYEQCAELRPGMYARTAAWWRYRSLYDGVERRGGASSMRIAIARRGTRDLGYIIYRQSFSMDRGMMEGTAKIIEMIALDSQAEATLWKYACNVDLYPKLNWWNAPVDTALPWLVADSRQVHRSRRDTLWLHIFDIRKALEARSYRHEGRITMTIGSDESMASASEWELVVSEGAAECRPYSGETDLQLSRQSLSSLYLGGFCPSELASAGRLRGSLAAIQRADLFFGGVPAPWCTEVF